MGVRSRFWILDTPESRSGCMQMHIDGKRAEEEGGQEVSVWLITRSDQLINLGPLMI